MMISRFFNKNGRRRKSRSLAATVADSDSDANAEDVQQKLQDAKNIVKEIPCSSLSPLDSSLEEGSLVHLEGCPVVYQNPLGQQDKDPLLSGVPLDELLGYRLATTMKVLQWEEFAFTKKVGKKTVRDYLYFREWFGSNPPANTSFARNGLECKIKNGDRPCYQWDPAVVEESWWNESGYELGINTIEFSTQNISVGGEYYQIPKDAFLQMIKKLEDTTSTLLPEPQVVTPSCGSDSDENEDGSDLRKLLPCAPGDNGAYLLQDDGRGSGVAFVVWQQLDSNGTMIDYMVRQYLVYKIDTISILAAVQQSGNSFVPWPNNNINSNATDSTTTPQAQPLLYEFVPGSVSANEMIDSAILRSSSAMTTTVSTWIWFWIASVVFSSGLSISCCSCRQKNANKRSEYTEL